MNSADLVRGSISWKLRPTVETIGTAMTSARNTSAGAMWRYPARLRGTRGTCQLSPVHERRKWRGKAQAERRRGRNAPRRLATGLFLGRVDLLIPERDDLVKGGLRLLLALQDLLEGVEEGPVQLLEIGRRQQEKVVLRIAVEHLRDLLEDRVVGARQRRDRGLGGEREAHLLGQIGAGLVAQQELDELPCFLLVRGFRRDRQPAARPLIAAGLVAPGGG